MSDPKKYVVVIRKYQQGYVASIPAFPEFSIIGDTRDEVLEDACDLIEQQIKALHSKGMPMPPPDTEDLSVEIECGAVIVDHNPKDRDEYLAFEANEYNTLIGNGGNLNHARP